MKDATAKPVEHLTDVLGPKDYFLPVGIELEIQPSPERNDMFEFVNYELRHAQLVIVFGPTPLCGLVQKWKHQGATLHEARVRVVV